VTLDGTSGQLSGAPTAVGTYSGVVTASNGVFADDSQPFSITVGKASVDLRVYPFTKQVGETATGVAGVYDGYGPTGTVRLTAYGPGDADCSGQPVFEQTLPVAGDVAVLFTDPFLPAKAGTYRWSAAYSGDAQNEPVQAVCTAESDVARMATDLSLEVRGGGEVGSGLLARAALSGGREPTGEITLSLHGPDDATCGRPPILTRALPVAGGEPVEASFTPPTPGAYRWKATYSGDEQNAGSVQPCSGPLRIVDTLAPESVITAKPRKPVKSRVKFAFAADDAASTFECRVDAGPWRPCTSPTTLKKLKPGRHRFSVRAADAYGNVEASPATAQFKVKKRKRKR
jgi:hypothetical protein